MLIIEITDKRHWNDFISAQKYAQFLQSWQWGEFHKKMGRKVWRFAVVDNTNQHEWESESTRKDLNGEIVLVAQIIKYELPFGQSYLYSPRGPSLVKSLKLKACPELAERVKSEGINLLFKKIKELARKEKSIFFRFEPICENAKCKTPYLTAGRQDAKLWNIFFKKNENLFIDENIIINHLNKVKAVQPEKEWFLDLSKNEDELLKEMQQKTRYNMRLAEKKGVQIRVACLNDNSVCRSDGKDDFDKFWNLISATYNRKQIRTHSKEYYKGILEIGWESNCNIKNCGAAVKLWLAEYEGKIIAANIVSYFGDTATYMHGGADYEYRNIMAPYLLQWKAIKEAQANGYKYYNFGGFSETNSYWLGITRFKKGFGGFELDYKGTYEIGFKRFLYKLYSFAKKLSGNS